MRRLVLVFFVLGIGSLFANSRNEDSASQNSQRIQVEETESEKKSENGRAEGERASADSEEDFPRTRKYQASWGQIFYKDSSSGGQPMGTPIQPVLSYVMPAITFTRDEVEENEENPPLNNSAVDSTAELERIQALYQGQRLKGWPDLGVQSPHRKWNIFYVAKREFRHFRRW